MSTCCHCLFWKARSFTQGVCWKHGGVTVGKDETCDQFKDRLECRPVVREQADGWSETSDAMEK